MFWDIFIRDTFVCQWHSFGMNRMTPTIRFFLNTQLISFLLVIIEIFGCHILDNLKKCSIFKETWSTSPRKRKVRSANFIQNYQNVPIWQDRCKIYFLWILKTIKRICKITFDGSFAELVAQLRATEFQKWRNTKYGLFARFCTWY